jgi:peroxiredoxin Q/BCP
MTGTNNMAPVSLGAQAPDFELASTNGETFVLSSERGKSNVVIFFLNDTGGGTDTQIAESFRDASELFGGARTTIVGICSAPLNKLQALKEKLSLPFELLSDDETIGFMYGVHIRQGFGPFSRQKFSRSTFLLDRTGVIRRIFRDVGMKDHINEVLASLDTDL